VDSQTDEGEPQQTVQQKVCSFIRESSDEDSSDSRVLRECRGKAPKKGELAKYLKGLQSEFGDCEKDEECKAKLTKEMREN